MNSHLSTQVPFGYNLQGKNVTKTYSILEYKLKYFSKVWSGPYEVWSPIVGIIGRTHYLHAAILFVGVDKGDPYSWHKHFVNVCRQIACVYKKQPQNI